MLKNLKLGLIAFICMGSSFAANAQKAIKEGTITYAVEYNLPPDQQSMAAMLPTEYKIEFKGDLSRFKMDMGMFATSVIYNDATKEMMSLTEIPMQNKKIGVKMNKDQAKKMQDLQSGEKEFEIQTTTDTKQIAGYNCKKFIFKDKISGESMDVWATNDVKIPENTFSAALIGLNGFPVQFENNARGMKSKLTLKNIKEEPITAIDMTIPSGFEIMTFEDIMAQMGG